MTPARPKDPRPPSDRANASLEEDLSPPAGRPVYTLAIAAQLLGLAPRTLRAYEEAGLIEPARSGRNHRRLYTPQDLRWLRCIYEMVHDEGYNLRSIRRLLDFAPCWEIRQCSPKVSRRCQRYLRIPGMAQAATAVAEDQGDRALARPITSASPARAQDDTADAPTSPVPGVLVHIQLIYGLMEYGAVMHCSRCLHAERVVRRVAVEYGERVLVTKHDILSREAQKYGVLMTPTLIINGEVVSVGKAVSQARLRELIDKYMAAELQRRHDSDDEGRG